MKTKEFFEKYNNKKIDFDGQYNAQCVDLFNQYLVEVLGITNPIQQFPVMSAYQIYDYGKNNPNFVCIPNDPTAIPQTGDIMVWNQGVGQWGHVAIFDSGDIMNFTSFDQNWNGVQKCQYVNHSYNFVTGWLRPKRNVSEITSIKPIVQESVTTITTHAHTEPIKEKVKPVWDLAFLDGQKTNLIAAGVVIVSVLYSQGYIDEKLFTTIDLIATGLVGLTLRDAIKKK